jgi:hypothetical protein
MGNIEAAEQGPEAYAKRYARRRVYRASNRATVSFLRAIGLSGRR